MCFAHVHVSSTRRPPSVSTLVSRLGMAGAGGQGQPQVVFAGFPNYSNFPLLVCLNWSESAEYHLKGFHSFENHTVEENTQRQVRRKKELWLIRSRAFIMVAQRFQNDTETNRPNEPCTSYTSALIDLHFEEEMRKLMTSVASFGPKDRRPRIYPQPL